jgi:hypothetical protein
MSQSIDLELVSWQVVSTLALSPSEFLAAMEAWTNMHADDPGFEQELAKRIRELSELLSTLKNNFVDSTGLRSCEPVEELASLLDLVVFHLDKGHSTGPAIREQRIWGIIRRLARVSLSEAGLEPSVPDDWFPTAAIV